MIYKPFIQKLGMAHAVGITVGSSVLFGLDGETLETIEETITQVEELLAENILSIASVNKEITAKHGIKEKIDHHSMGIENRPPYVYVEEAFPAAVSRNLTEEQIWLIHGQATQRRGMKRNSNPMPDVDLGE